MTMIRITRPPTVVALIIETRVVVVTRVSPISVIVVCHASGLMMMRGSGNVVMMPDDA